jgi:hypothetical protein
VKPACILSTYPEPETDRVRALFRSEDENGDTAVEEIQTTDKHPESEDALSFKRYWAILEET